MRPVTFSTLVGAVINALSLSLTVQAASQKQETPRPDGSTIHWFLDLPDAPESKVGLVVIMQGSGCEPVAKSKSLALTRAAFPEFATVTADKYGIDPDADFEGKDNTSCPQRYHEKSTSSQRVADYQQILNSLSLAQWWNGQLILVGGSEGGDIAARLAAQSRSDAVVLISTGGGTTFGELVRASLIEEMERQSVPPSQWLDIDGMFARARANPESTEVEAGYSYRYWADSIDLKTVDDMLKTAAPILLIQGTDDTSTPLYTARTAVDTFIKEKRCNLTYWEKTGYNHSMVDPDGNNRLQEVLTQASSWVHHQLQHSNVSPCMKPNSFASHVFFPDFANRTDSTTTLMRSTAKASP